MKNTTPFIVIVFIVVIGAAFWFAQKPKEPIALLPEVAPLPASVSTSTPTAPKPAAPAPTPSVSVGTDVTGKTVWRDITADIWNLMFKVQTSWKVSGVYDDDKKLTQVSVGGELANYFVSRNIRIAEPSNLPYTKTKRVVAGETVTVHYYKNPNTAYEAYEYFSVENKTDTYYFQIKERAGSTKEVEDFIEFIEFK